MEWNQNSVIFRWLGPKGTIITNNSIVTITPTITSSNTFASTVQFSYLMEGDEGKLHMLCDDTQSF